jgi:pimeloyl-ACP methyl ester carboxylesterase
VSQVALEAVQVGAGSAVADVAVRPDDVVRRLLHTQPRERLPIDAIQGAGQRWPCRSGPLAFECRSAVLISSGSGREGHRGGVQVAAERPLSIWLGIRDPDRVVGIHLIHPKLPTTIDPDRPLSTAEQAYLDRREVEDETDGGYSAIQATRPDTLAAALMDSPQDWPPGSWTSIEPGATATGDLETRFSRDDLLTIITLYWATGTIGSSFRTYYDYPHNPPRPLITVPTGVTLTVEDVGYPRELAERSYTDIRHWRVPTAGGHFLPLEEPELLAGELRSFFRSLRHS